MVRIADIVDPIFREYAPVAERAHLSLDLDLADPLIEVKQPDQLKSALKKYLDFTISLGPQKGHLVISGGNNTLVIKDSSTVLTPEQRQNLTSKTVSVKSRVGFGTTVIIAL